MAFASGFNKSEAQLLLTLSNLTYEDPTPLPGESVDQQATRMRTHINAALVAPPSYGDWQVAWGPALTEDRSNMMYVAESPTLNQCAVAIRGTNWAYIEDWLQDFGALLSLTTFPYIPEGTTEGTVNIKIALGTLAGLQTLIGMQGALGNGEKTDLAAFLQGKLQAGADIFVVGHSLGGCLASVIAPWLAFLQGSAEHMKVYTFAAPSAGNAEFASYFDNLFLDSAGQSMAFRVYNSLDAVPNAWASLPLISAYYRPAPACTLELKLLLAAAELRLGAQYVQPGDESQSAVRLEGTVLAATAQAVLSIPDDEAFVHEITLQHSPSTYLALLGS